MLLLEQGPVLPDPFIGHCQGSNASSDQQTIFWQTNHSEMPSPFSTYPLGTRWPFKKGDRHNQGRLGPWPRDGHASLTAREGEPPGVRRKQEFKLLHWFCRCSYLRSINYTGCQSGEKGARRALTLLTFQKGCCQKLGLEVFLCFSTHKKWEQEEEKARDLKVWGVPVR